MTLTQINVDSEFKTCDVCGEYRLTYTAVFDRDTSKYIPGYKCLACKSEFTGTPVETALIDVTNQDAGTYYEVVKVRNLSNIVFQYNLIAGADNTIELQLWGTVYASAEDSTEDDWANITEFLTEEETLSVTNESLQDMAITDSNCPFAKVKIKYIVTATTPDNAIKVGCNGGR